MPMPIGFPYIFLADTTFLSKALIRLEIISRAIGSNFSVVRPTATIAGIISAIILLRASIFNSCFS